MIFKIVACVPHKVGEVGVGLKDEKGEPLPTTPSYTYAVEAAGLAGERLHFQSSEELEIGTEYSLARRQVTPVADDAAAQTEG